MAGSATMSHQQPQANKKLGSLGQDCFTDSVLDHDMHLKMSKKIAQLTKVIYALNTKNDEHEQIVKSLQQQHEKDRQQILAETKVKLDAIKNRLGAENELKKNIDSLEATVEEYENEKRKLIQDFERFKHQCSENERVLKQEHQQTVAVLSKELSQYQKDFSDKMKIFETFISKFEKEKDDFVRELNQTHQREIDNLLKAQKTSSVNLVHELDALKAQYNEEIQQLKLSYSQLKIAKESSETDYEEKFKKVKILHEKELELLRQTQSASMTEKENLLRNQLDKLTKEFQFNDTQYRQRVDSLLNELSQSEAKIKELQADVSSLSQIKQSSSDEIRSLNEQLQQIKEEASNYLSDFRTVERELQITKERTNEQSKHLLQKSAIIGDLTASASQKDSKIEQLERELKKIDSQLKILRDEKNSLLSKTSDEFQEKHREAQALEQALRDLNMEKQNLIDKYEFDVKALEDKLVEESKRAKMELEETITRLQNQHQDYIKKVIYDEAAKRAVVDEEVAKLERILSELKILHENEKMDLLSKLKASENEFQNLRHRVNDTSSNLSTANTELSEARNKVMDLEKQLKQSNAELRSSSKEISQLQETVANLRNASKKQIEEHEKDLKRKLEELQKSLDTTWLEKLQQELSNLKNELERQFHNDRTAAIQNLNSKKSEELGELAREYENKMLQLNKKVNELEKVIQNEKLAADSSIMSVKAKFENTIKEMQKELDQCKADNEQAVRNLLLSSEREKQEKVAELTKMYEENLAELKNKHIQDISAQLSAHKLAVDLMAKEAENQRLQERDTLYKTHQQDRAALKEELLNKYQKEAEANNLNNMKQITAIRMELQRSIELKSQRDAELANLREELENRIDHRDRTIKSLEVTKSQLDESINQLRRELEKKVEEILHVRSEATKQIRKREEDLQKQQKEKIEEMKAHQTHEMQNVLADFSQAQALLKDKISELTLLLEAAEERYRNREPREEDIVLIEQLRRSLMEQEEEMNHLIAEKQFFQLELVNRETNFTKVFAGNKGGPQQLQVGLINPLAKKKKGEKGPTKYSVKIENSEGTHSGNNSANNLERHRLRPIDGSPIHDERLNPNDVLPSPHFTKKFIQ